MSENGRVLIARSLRFLASILSPPLPSSWSTISSHGIAFKVSNSSKVTVKYPPILQTEESHDLGTK